VKQGHTISNSRELEQISAVALQDLYPTEGVRINIGMGTCGLACAAGEIHTRLQERANTNGWTVASVGCLGLCKDEPLVEVYRSGAPRIVYGNVDEALMDRIMDELEQGVTCTEGALFKVVEETLLVQDKDLAFGKAKDLKDIPLITEHPFFGTQYKIALRNCGAIDPSSIDEYIGRGGYTALAQVLQDNDPAGAVQCVTDAGLRGRGGGGFLAGRKWESTARAKGDTKYVICNADEGDPGAYMDRTIMEGDPHSVVEGMIIGGFAMGATAGYVYIRTEYPLAVQTIEKAINDAHDRGLLGKNILGSGFDFDVLIARGSGAFVCGESSALIASIEGKPGEPRAKHVHMAESGLYGKPTALNNVETWANVPVIIDRGADYFTSIGTSGSSGTKVFSLTGNVDIPGLVEVPMGMSLLDIVNTIGGGAPEGRKLKAVQTGGPSGGCIPAELMHLPVDFDSLWEAGSMMGSGGMIVMDENTCMVDVARFFVDFLAEESCGKCTSCREGLHHMHQVLIRICAGEGKEGDIEFLEDLCEVVGQGSLCGLGTSAPNPVLSTLKYFRKEYEAHIKDKQCAAKVCRALIRYDIDKDNCTGCTACSRKCPVAAISGERKGVHTIDQALCIQCGQCMEVCKFNALRVS